VTWRASFLSTLAIDEEAEQQTVVVAERSGTRRFPILIGQLEALAIDRAVKGQVFPRPLTHDLLLALVAALHADIREVRITDVRGGTFYAALVLARADGSLVEMDCRPSDALAVLVRRPETPLLVAEEVLAEAGG
jgi:bifunctional DNase/RNase